MNEVVSVRKNGQTASGRTRRILNRGNGLYIIRGTRDDKILLTCTMTNWNGWLPYSEIMLDRKIIGQ